MKESTDLDTILAEVRVCRLCELEQGPRPLLQLALGANILIAGQAPGSRAHASCVPFDDPSGDRLRDWLGISRDAFYDPGRVALLPMGFCYPGRGRSGDLPPRPLCAPTWRSRLLEAAGDFRLTIVLGAHALAWHLPEHRGDLTGAVRRWRELPSGLIVLPHPSPRNNPWLRRHPWFATELLPELRVMVREALTAP